MQRMHDIAKVLFPTLLIFSVIPVSLTATVRGQNFTATHYSTTTITSNMSTPVHEVLVLFARASNRPCTYAYTTISNVKAGQRFVGDISVMPSSPSLPVPRTDFHLFNSTGFDTFQSTAYSSPRCGTPGAYINVREMVSHHVDFAFPKDGGYYMVFVNLSSDNAEKIVMTGVLFGLVSVVEVFTTVETWGILLPEAISFIAVSTIGIVLLVALRIAKDRRHRASLDMRG